MPEQTEVFPGVLRHVEYRMAVYVGQAPALIAAGLVTRQQLPGQAGNGRGMCTYDADGSKVHRGCSRSASADHKYNAAKRSHSDSSHPSMKSSAVLPKIVAWNIDDMSIRREGRPVLRPNAMPYSVQGSLALILAGFLELFPEIWREGNNRARCAVCIFKPKGAAYPVQRDALSFGPLSQIGIQQLLSIHFGEFAVGECKVCPRRHLPTRVKPDIPVDKLEPCGGAVA